MNRNGELGPLREKTYRRVFIRITNANAMDALEHSVIVVCEIDARVSSKYARRSVVFAYTLLQVDETDKVF